MSGDVVEAAKAALEGVTEGPWLWHKDYLQGGQGGHDEVLAPGPVDCMSYCYGGSSVIESDNPDRDREFIAASRTLIPELVAEVERLRASLVRTQSDVLQAGDALDRIGVIVGWGSNPEPDDAEDALYEVRRVLYDYALGGAS